MRRRAAVDANQPVVTEELRARGYSVWLTHALGKGGPDMVVGCPGVNLLVELKINKKQELTDDEITFRNKWNGPMMTATSSDEIHGYMVRLRSLVTLPE